MLKEGRSWRKRQVINRFLVGIRLQQVAWVWLMEKIGQSRSTIDDAVWKGRQMRTIIELFGDGVLYFKDDILRSSESRFALECIDLIRNDY